MRRALPLACALLGAGCSQETTPPPAQDESADLVECAPAGTIRFQRICSVERAQGEEGAELVLRNPDGSFHRLRIVDDGRGVAAADGAEPLAIEYAENSIAVGIGGDRYVLPSTAGSADAGR